MNGHTNRHNCYIWGQEHPHEIYQHVKDSPKDNVWCGIMHDCLIGPLSFAENTITANKHLDMMPWFAFPQTDGIEQEEKTKILFQQGGVPHHFSHKA